MKFKYLTLGVSLAALNAASVAASETIHIKDPIIVTAPAIEAGSPTALDNESARQQITQTPGGVGLVTDTEIENKVTQNYEDTLFLVPGVSARKRFGEEVRLSIRGSGLSRGFHMRGLKILQDGIPFNLADGSADFQELDPNATQRIEIYKGGNALEFGGTTLGGAVNTVTKTGRSHPGTSLNLEFGSYQTLRSHAETGTASDNYDLFASITGITSSGRREHEDQQSVKFNGNAGLRLSDSVETRFYLSANDIDQELSGSVSREDALSTPKKANPSSITSDWQRDIRSIRLANKTTFLLGDDEKLDVGAFLNLKDLFHPITPFVGVIDQQSRDVGFFVEMSGNTAIAEHDNRYRVGIKGQWGTVNANVYQNIGGYRGNLTSDLEQEATDLVLYGENAFYVVPSVALVTGAQVSIATRKVTDHLTPTESDSKTYHSLNPKIGFLYEPTDQLQFFANVSYSDEVPTFSELTQSGTVGFTPVSSQKAWTAEIGTRGEMGKASWDLSIYRAWIRDEMLQFTTGPGIPAATFNADDTIHQGIELGLSLNLAENLFAEADQLTWRNSYTFSDFFFDDDSQYGDNRIPGIARHVYQTELRYTHKDNWFIAPNIEISSKADVDFENTLETPGYAVLNLSAGYNINENISLYLDARNLLDKRYISTFSTLVNGAGNTAVYYPGEGRRAFVGLRAKF